MDWELRLNDAMSSPAARMAAALKPVEDKLRDVNKQLASSAIDRMNDGLEKQRAQLRLQRADLAAGLRAAKVQERAEAQMDRAASRARAVAMREDRLRARAAEAQARVEQRAKAAADRYFQRSAQQRQRLDEQVRSRQARALAASARQEQAVQRAAQRAAVRDQRRSWAAMQREQSTTLQGERGEGLGMLPGKAGILMAVAAAALAAAAAVGALGAAFTRAVVDAVAFREAAIGGLTQVMKNAGGARQVFQVGVSLAARWNLDPREMVTQLQDLVSKGFSAKEARVLLTASADLKVMNPNANIAGIMLAIGQIRSKGVLQMEELQGQLAEAGINVGKTLELIGKKLGKSTTEVRKMISAGKIDSNTGIWAIVKSIEEMGGGKLGSVADKAAQSISSMMEGLKFRPGLLALKIAEMMEGGAGETALGNALSQLLAATNPEGSPGMKRLLAGASKLSNELLQLIFGPASTGKGGRGLQYILDRTAVAVELIADGIKAARPVVHAFLEGFAEGGRWVVDILLALGKSLGFGKELSSGAGAARTLGKALAVIAGVAAGLVVAIVATSAQIMAFVHVMASAPAAVVSAATGIAGAIQALPAMLLSAGVLMGTNLWTGFVQGIQSGITAVTDAASRLATAARSAVGDALAIRSPSRVMMEMGGHTAEGFAQGVDDGSGQVDASMRDMVAPPAPVLGQGGSTTSNTLSAGGITVNVVVQGDGSGPDPKALGAEVSAAVAQALENLLAQMGLSPTPA
jgi:tape measure domain-containing protein